MKLNSNLEYEQNIELEILSSVGGGQVILELNETQTLDCHDMCIHQLFEIQVERSPQAIAVVFENKQLTYGQLNQQANQLAHHLRSLGVGPEVLVGICLERSLEMVVGLLGILKAGGAYVPLDPAYPLERLAFILADTQTPILLTQEKLLKSLPPHQAQVVCLDSDWELITHNSQENLICKATTDNLIYTIYTSGSTGVPKGVMIPHRGISNQLYWRQTTFELTSADKVLQTISLSFDPSVWQIFWPLCYGAQLIMARPGGHQDTAYLVKLIAEQQITVIALVPSILRVLLEEEGIENCQSLRHITCGGEALPVELIERFFARLNLDNVLHNCYGPTEASIDATFWKCQRGSDYVIAPIGSPIANAEIYILDEDLQPVDVGEPGELYIGGAGLAQGYLNRPQLTAEKFIPHPLNSKPGARLYRSGDLARYMSDGNIEFLGRIDDQVKIRGLRIELGEIDAILSQHPDVDQTIVIAREDIPGDKRLVAYLVPNQQQEIPTSDELRRFLRQKLPDYMVPASFVTLEFLPLTPNGKVDRRRLPAPTQTQQKTPAARVAPQDELELQLTKIWEKVLEIKPVGVNDDFFDLGGNSLLAVRLFAEIEKTFGKNLSLSTMFQAPTIEQLASLIRQEQELSASWSSLVAIQPNGTQLPLFCIHAIWGNVLAYRDLARHLGSDQPVYGLQAQGLDGKHPPHTRIEDMAAHYIKEIQTVQPDGPYFLGGHSFGGIVALEMAQQLQAQGQKVSLLVMFDTFAPGSVKRSPLVKQLTLHSYNLLKKGPVYLQEKAVDKWFQDKFKEIIYKFYLRAGLTLPRRFRNIYLKQVNQQAYGEYVLRPYPGKLTLMQIDEQMKKAQSVSATFAPQLGWGNLVIGELESYYVPGNHDSLLKQPHVQVLAAKLRACLEKARAND